MSNGKGIGVIEVEANIAEGIGSNVYEKWWDKIKAARDEIEAAIKASLVLFLTIFGILTFKQAFPGLCNKILFDIWMVFLLMCILSLGIILYAINTISPRSQKTKSAKNLSPHSQETKIEKTLVSDLRETFTHIIALIITVPLIIVTCILLVVGNHPEELTFISGLLGVIVGFYFGHRGIESAESRSEKALKEKNDAVNLRENAEQNLKKERRKTANSLVEETTEDSKESSYQKKEAWDRFKKEVKKDKKDFKGVENIDKYLPWEEKPEGDWNNEERKYIMQFEEEWKLLGGE